MLQKITEIDFDDCPEQQADVSTDPVDIFVGKLKEISPSPCCYCAFFRLCIFYTIYIKSYLSVRYTIYLKHNNIIIS